VSLLTDRIEGGPYRFGRGRVVTISDREHGVEQAGVNKLRVAGGDRLVDAMAISDSPLSGTRNLA